MRKCTMRFWAFLIKPESVSTTWAFSSCYKVIKQITLWITVLCCFLLLMRFSDWNTSFHGLFWTYVRFKQSQAYFYNLMPLLDKESLNGKNRCLVCWAIKIINLFIHQSVNSLILKDAFIRNAFLIKRFF